MLWNTSIIGSISALAISVTYSYSIRLSSLQNLFGFLASVYLVIRIGAVFLVKGRK